MSDTILIIEDEKGIRENLLYLLENSGYEVISANNGRDGVKLACECDPDLIICDIMMPGFSGYEVLETLLSRIPPFQAPFIFLTAKVEMTDLRLGMGLGADDYIFKPFDANELLEAVSTRLKKYQRVKKIFKSEVAGKMRLNLTDMFSFKVRGHAVFVSIEKIVYITADRQYSSVYTKENKRFVIKRAIGSWEEILPAKHFVRIHRSTLINLNHVNKIQKNENGLYKIHLNNSEIILDVSRRFYKNLKKPTDQ